MCADTKELRTNNGIEDPVTYLTGNPSTPPADNGNDEDGDEVRQHLREMNKEDLISSFIHVQKGMTNAQKEVTKCNNIIQSLRLQRDWIIDKKPQLMEFLELIDTLTDARDAEASVSSHTVATTVTPNSIEKTWDEVCASSDYWRQWW